MKINPSLIHKLQNSYDIRSIDLTLEDAFLFGKAFGSQLREHDKKSAVIGYDRRELSKQLHDSFVNGIISTGINITSIGRAPTPEIQLAQINLKTDAAVAITASHNPCEYNGIKFFVDNAPFANEKLSNLVTRILQRNFYTGTGSVTHIKFHQEYIDFLETLIKIKGKFKIGIDFLNGSGADVFPYAQKLFNGRYFILNDKLDYTFGGFPPDPTYEPRLDGIKSLIIQKQLDFALIFDGDMDRCTLMDNKCNLIQGDTLTSLLAYFTYKLKNRRIKTIIDSKSSMMFAKWMKPYSDYFISVTGHPNLVNLFNINEADIGGECSGHYIFKENLGISDGLYTALRFISHLEENNISLEAALNLLPTIWSAEPKVIKCLEEDKAKIIDKIINILSRQGITLDLSDGVKAHLNTGWWMIRPSRTEEILRICAEGWTQEGLENVQEHLNTILNSLDLI